MKKLFLISILILFSLIGCAEGDPATEQTGDEPSLLAPVASEYSEAEAVLGNFILLEEGVTSSDNRDSGVEIISLEEAAAIGERYIFEILGESLKGKYVQLSYNHNFNLVEGSPHQNTWYGAVARSLEDLENNYSVFTFLLNAETGTLLDVMNWQLEPVHDLDFLEMEQLTEAEWWELFPRPSEEEIEMMRQVAIKYAQRYFSETTISNIEIGFYGEETDFLAKPNNFFVFNVTDETGHVMNVFLQRETNLFSLMEFPLKATDFGLE